MSRVDIAGVILPENFWLEENVATLAKFQQELALCEDGIELHIDSPGGDVMTSNSMSALIAEWCLNHPNRECKCVIGGLCASAAANILAKLPSCFKKYCYQDTLTMYHSCYGMVEGSPDTLRDNAVLMDLVNDVVIKNLLAKTTLDEERVRTAFRAGREMWLDGEEAVACGLLDGIIDGNADFTVRNTVYEEKDDTEAYRYAACVARNMKTKLEAKLMAEENKEPQVDETEEAKAKALAAEAEEEKETETDEQEPDVEETEAECDDDEKKEAECDEDETKAEVNAEMQALKAENESLKAEIESLKAIVAKYNVSANADAQPTRKTFSQLMKEIPAGLSQSEYARRYSALKREHKAEYEEFMGAHQSR